MRSIAFHCSFAAWGIIMSRLSEIDHLDFDIHISKCQPTTTQPRSFLEHFHELFLLFLVSALLRIVHIFHQSRPHLERKFPGYDNLNIMHYSFIKHASYPMRNSPRRLRGTIGQRVSLLRRPRREWKLKVVSSSLTVGAIFWHFGCWMQDILAENDPAPRIKYVVVGSKTLKTADWIAFNMRMLRFLLTEVNLNFGVLKFRTFEILMTTCRSPSFDHMLLKDWAISAKNFVSLSSVIMILQRNSHSQFGPLLAPKSCVHCEVKWKVEGRQNPDICLYMKDGLYWTELLCPYKLH